MTPGEILLRLMRIRAEIPRRLRLPPTDWREIAALADEARRLEDDLAATEAELKLARNAPGGAL